MTRASKIELALWLSLALVATVTGGLCAVHGPTLGAPIAIAVSILCLNRALPLPRDFMPVMTAFWTLTLTLHVILFWALHHWFATAENVPVAHSGRTTVENAMASALTVSSLMTLVLIVYVALARVVVHANALVERTRREAAEDKEAEKPDNKALEQNQTAGRNP